MVLQLEHLVLRVGARCHEVDTRADIAASDEFESEGVAGGGDTVGAAVVCTIDSTVLSARSGVSTKGSIPSVTGVAVGVSTGGVEPTPVSVEGDSAVLGGASSTRSALLNADLGVGLSSLSTSLLTVNGREECE